MKIGRLIGKRLQKYPISASYRKLPKVQLGIRKIVGHTFN